ncbi:MAG: glycosyltransferase family 2 protein [Elusimicrobiota bacterium]
MKVSLVIPVFNEGENLSLLYDELKKNLSGTGGGYEIIFVDDGSSDNSAEILKKMASTANVKVIRFTRNYGQTAALSAGFQKAAGDVVVTMDADLQNNPADIQRLIKILLDTGVDAVSGWRYRRKDPFLRIVVSGIANLIISRICGLKLHDYGCTLKAYRAISVKDLKLYGEMHRYIPAFIHWNGGHVIEAKVSHRPRIYGKSSYGMGRIYRVILDLLTTVFLTTYSTKPIHVFGSLGLASITGGIIVSVYVIIRKMYLGGQYMSPLFFVAVFLAGLGLIMIFMGIIAEISVRIYFAQKDNFPYRINENKE